MSSIPVSATQMAELLAHAKRIGTTEHWLVAALEWMHNAETQGAALMQERDELRDRLRGGYGVMLCCRPISKDTDLLRTAWIAAVDQLIRDWDAALAGEKP